MKTKIKTGEVVKIVEDGGALEIYDANENDLIFVLEPPEHGSFYCFALHYQEGECPIVSFGHEHSINGWPDWYFKINVHNKSLEKLNPWK